MDKFLLTVSLGTIVIFLSAAIASSRKKHEKKQEYNYMTLEEDQDDFGSRWLDLEHHLGMDLSRDHASLLIWLIDMRKIALLARTNTPMKKPAPEPEPQLSTAEQEQNRLRFCRWLVVHGRLTDELPQETAER